MNRVMPWFTNGYTADICLIRWHETNVVGEQANNNAKPTDNN